MKAAIAGLIKEAIVGEIAAKPNFSSKSTLELSLANKQTNNEERKISEKDEDTAGTGSKIHAVERMIHSSTNFQMKLIPNANGSHPFRAIHFLF